MKYSYFKKTLSKEKQKAHKPRLQGNMGIFETSLQLLLIWMKEVLGCEVDNEGYLINCFEKLSCKEKSTVFETLFINTGKPCVLDGISQPSHHNC